MSPSLQMGDSSDPVDIYYWNSTRGAMLMQAAGRGTTRRTGQTFPAQGQYGGGQWSVTLELPNLPAGTPLAFAVWNGSQKDRDGRKYFSVWQILK
jgi:DMSO reductase family type II enzyme heme b subunit